MKHPRVETPPVLEPPLPPGIIFDRVEDPHIPSGDIPPHWSLPPMRPANAEDEIGLLGSFLILF